MKKSYIIAGTIVLLLAVWIFSGQTSNGKHPDPDTETPELTQQDKLVAVRTINMEAQQHTVQLVLRGRTESLRKVELRSQTKGRVAKTPATKGDLVKEGDVICQLDIDDRDAKLAEASALRDQRRLEYEAAEELFRKGHRSDTQTAAAKAQYDAAKAQVRQMEVNRDHAEITAPFAGIIDERQAEIGDYLKEGDVCAVIMDQDPFLVVGYVSEQNVGPLKENISADVTLSTGQRLSGKLSYISKIAVPETRTFRIEVEVANPDNTLRDGVTADIRLPLMTMQAHHLSPAALVLDDEGVVGLRVVQEDNTIAFYPVEIIDSDGKGVWVTGLPAQANVVTVGQEYVKAGQTVRIP